MEKLRQRVLKYCPKSHSWQVTEVGSDFRLWLHNHCTKNHYLEIQIGKWCKNTDGTQYLAYHSQFFRSGLPLTIPLVGKSLHFKCLDLAGEKLYNSSLWKRKLKKKKKQVRGGGGNSIPEKTTGSRSQIQFTSVCCFHFSYAWDILGPTWFSFPLLSLISICISNSLCSGSLALDWHPSRYSKWGWHSSAGTLPPGDSAWFRALEWKEMRGPGMPTLLQEMPLGLFFGSQFMVSNLRSIVIIRKKVTPNPIHYFALWTHPLICIPCQSFKPESWAVTPHSQPALDSFSVSFPL